jgi:hypothetical protein
MTNKLALFAFQLIGIAYIAPACSQPAAVSDVAKLFVGAWRAAPAGIYTENADGTRTYPFGQDAVTRFLLTADGYAANTLQYRNRAKCATGTGPRSCTALEAEAAFQSASSYQYRYRLTPDPDNPYKGTMTWDIDLTVYPNWQNQSLTRRYEMKPDGTGWMFLAPLPSNPSFGLKVILEREKP